MKVFSICDLGDAKFILSQVGKADKFGKPMINAECLQWAQEVLDFFRKLWAMARSYVGSWAARIKLAWIAIRREIKNACLDWRQAGKVQGEKIVNGVLYLGSDEKFNPQGKIRSAKHRRYCNRRWW